MLEDDEEKLRIPAPDEDEEPEDDQGVFVLAAAISILLGLAFFLYQYERGQGEPDEPSGQTSVGEQSSEKSERLQKLARGLRDRRNREGLEDHDWSDRELVAAFRFGPRYLSESACRHLFEDESRGSTAARVRRELLSLVDRRGDYTPWTCLFEAYFSTPSVLPDSVRREIEDLWEQFRVFDGPMRLFSTVISDFAESGTKPEASEFRRWLRLCGLHFGTYAGPACRRLLKRAPPGESGDLLGVVEFHLRHSEANPTFDIPILVDGLQVLAHDGQPSEWRVLETDTLADYDADLRIGAMFYLCRFVNSPNESVGRHAARALSHAAEFGVRAVDRTLRPRWIQGCRKAFGTDEGDAPALAVWTGESSDPPQYALKHTIDRGECRVRDGYPTWYCASEKWNAVEPEALADFFVQTREIEWRDRGPLELE